MATVGLFPSSRTPPPNLSWNGCRLTIQTTDQSSGEVRFSTVPPPLFSQICYCSLLFYLSPFLFILIYLPNSPLKPISFPFNQPTQAQPKFKINPITNSHFSFKTLFHPSLNYSIFIFFSLYFYKTHNLIFFSIFINKEFNLINYFF